MDKRNIYHDDTLWARWLAGELSEEELASLSAKEVSRMERIRDVADQLELEAHNQDASWEKLQQRIHAAGTFEPLPRNHGVSTPLRWGMGIAASLLIAVGLWIYFSAPKEYVIVAERGEHEHILFPDSSFVILNADSRLSYLPGKWDRLREVSLEGEAYFEVIKGKTFRVSTQQADVIVLGTSFNINTRSAHNTTICYTGKVKVVDHDRKWNRILTAGVGIRMHDDEWKLFRLEQKTSSPEWIHGKITFQSVNFVEVMNEIERQFDQQIVLSVDSQTLGTYTGYFFNDDLNEALRMVCEPMGLDYVVKNDSTIHISDEKSNIDE